jgi:hypothetical protein
METIFLTLLAVAAVLWLVFVAHRLGQAHSRLDLLRNQRRKAQRQRR